MTQGQLINAETPLPQIWQVFHENSTYFISDSVESGQLFYAACNALLLQAHKQQSHGSESVTTNIDHIYKQQEKCQRWLQMKSRKHGRVLFSTQQFRTPGFEERSTRTPLV